MPKEVSGYAVVPIVIDDHSEDDTADAARIAGALAATLPIRRGGGMALRVGYEIALQLGADIVVTLDADGQHLPEEIPVLIEPIVEADADHVNGSRMLGDYERGGGLVRHAGRALLLLARHDPDRAAHHRHLERVSRDAGRDPAQVDPRAGSVLDVRGHDRGVADNARASWRCPSRS